MNTYWNIYSYGRRLWHKAKEMYSLCFLCTDMNYVSSKKNESYNGIGAHMYDLRMAFVAS